MLMLSRRVLLSLSAYRNWTVGTEEIYLIGTQFGRDQEGVLWVAEQWSTVLPTLAASINTRLPHGGFMPSNSGHARIREATFEDREAISNLRQQLWMGTPVF